MKKHESQVLNEILKAAERRLKLKMVDPRHGLTSLILNIGLPAGASELYHRLVEDWPEHCGVRGFPITGGRGAYAHAMVDAAMWTGKYGAARKRLLKWLIEQTGEFK